MAMEKRNTSSTSTSTSAIKSFALFAQDELDLTSKWKLNLGARFDDSAYRPDFISPRAALIYQPSDRVSYKFLYGRAFRSPTAFELLYDDGGQTAIGNAAARPEKTDTFELVAERKLTRRVNALVSAYHYEVSNLLEGEYTASGALQYVNGPAVHASGLEVEFNGAGALARVYNQPVCPTHERFRIRYAATQLAGPGGQTAA